MRHSYPSDISREQFESLQALLEQARKKTKPRAVDLYDVFCAILYVLKSGCQWRMLPRDFPKWQLVYKYFRHWSQKPADDELSLLEQALKNVVGEVRITSGRNEKTSFVIVDAQSVKNRVVPLDMPLDL